MSRPSLAREHFRVASTAARLALDEVESMIDRADTDPAAIARRLYQLRRDRDSKFRRGTFKDPAWDLLLGLYVARAEGRSINVKAAIILPATSSTRAMRVIEELVADGLVTRTPSPTRKNSVLISLTPAAVTRMDGLLGQCG